MPPGLTDIRATLTSTERVRMVPTRHPGCQPIWDGGVRFLGYDVRPPHCTWGEGLSRTLLLFWVVEGRVHLDGHGLSAGPGECLVVPPNAAKRLLTREDPLLVAWLHCEWRRPWTRHGPLPQVVPAPWGPHVLEWVTALSEQTGGDAPAIGHHLARAILAACGSLGRGHDQRPSDPWSALWEEVAANPGRPWNALGLARRAGLSRAQFHRRVLAQHGITPMDRVRRLRLDRAMLLLQTTDLAVEAIAGEVGYSSGFALSNALLREEGRRPQTIRRQDCPRPPAG